MVSHKVNNMDILSANKYVKEILMKTLAKSQQHKLLHKFSTGYGLTQNLFELYLNRKINQLLYNNIMESHDFFDSLRVGQEINVDEWNENVLMQKHIINSLT
ncbi:hypothetical protein GCM10011409_11560 [Lentibacillus populi]|uniref:Uncharacterized protein n=2 Tax=Lentibacillus populi TaxID=1827502 RepID=A0A9W5TVL4_9BACI|nr:hypothetical protein GCM10011409_11560 [Lentibacillus populi]